MPPRFAAGAQLWVKTDDGIFWPAVACDPAGGEYDVDMLAFMLTDDGRVPDGCVKFYHDSEQVFPIDGSDTSTVRPALWGREKDDGEEAAEHRRLCQQPGVGRFAAMARQKSGAASSGATTPHRQLSGGGGSGGLAAPFLAAATPPSHQHTEQHLPPLFGGAEAANLPSSSAYGYNSSRSPSGSATELGGTHTSRVASMMMGGGSGTFSAPSPVASAPPGGYYGGGGGFDPNNSGGDGADAANAAAIAAFVGSSLFSAASTVGAPSVATSASHSTSTSASGSMAPPSARVASGSGWGSGGSSQQQQQQQQPPMSASAAYGSGGSRQPPAAAFGQSPAHATAAPPQRQSSATAAAGGRAAPSQLSQVTPAPPAPLRLSGEELKKARTYLKAMNPSDAVALAMAMGIPLSEIAAEGLTDDDGVGLRRNSTHSAVARTAMAGWSHGEADGAEGVDTSPLGRGRARRTAAASASTGVGRRSSASSAAALAVDARGGLGSAGNGERGEEGPSVVDEFLGMLSAQSAAVTSSAAAAVNASSAAAPATIPAAAPPTKIVIKSRVGGGATPPPAPAPVVTAAPPPARRTALALPPPSAPQSQPQPPQRTASAPSSSFASPALGGASSGELRPINIPAPPPGGSGSGGGRRPKFTHTSGWDDEMLHHLRYSIFDVFLPHSKDSLDPSWLFHNLLGAVTVGDASEATSVEFEGIDAELGYSFGASSGRDVNNMGRGGRRILLVAMSEDSFSCGHGWMEPVPIAEGVTLRMVVELAPASSDPDYDAGARPGRSGYVPPNWRLPSSQQNAVKTFVPLDVTEAFHDAVREQMVEIAAARGRGARGRGMRGGGGDDDNHTLSVRLNVLVENQSHARGIQLWGGVLALIAAAPVEPDQICKWVTTRPQLTAPLRRRSNPRECVGGGGGGGRVHVGAGAKRSRDGDDDEEEDVSFDDALGMTVSVQCPISLQLIGVPARGLRCTHQQCCELAFIVEICSASKVWACPYCKGPMPFREIIVDMPLLDYIEETPRRTREADPTALFRNGRYERCPSGGGGGSSQGGAGGGLGSRSSSSFAGGGGGRRLGGAGRSASGAAAAGAVTSPTTGHVSFGLAPRSSTLGSSSSQHHLHEVEELDD